MSDTTFTDIDNALNPKDLFGKDPTQARKKFLSYSRHIHPDMVAAKDKFRAQKSFTRLLQLWEQYSSTSSSHTPHTNRITSKKREYDLEGKLYDTSVSSVYRALYDARHKEAEIHITNSPLNNDLMGNAVSSLRTLKQVPSEYSAFFPHLIDKFRIKQQDGDHSVIACQHLDGFVSLEEVKKAYPQGLDGRDLGWIFKRVLVALGNTRDVGLCHGSFTPENIFIHPEQHGFILNNWEYSVELGKPLSAVSVPYRDFYPQQILDKGDVTSSLDMSLAVKTMLNLVGPKTGKPGVRFKAFFKGCLGEGASIPHPSELLHEFDEFLFSLYGRPSFHPFSMP